MYGCLRETHHRATARHLPLKLHIWSYDHAVINYNTRIVNGAMTAQNSTVSVGLAQSIEIGFRAKETVNSQQRV